MCKKNQLNQALRSHLASDFLIWKTVQKQALNESSESVG
jgi:hypothetical protein